MREVVFHLQGDHPGVLIARSESPRPVVSAASLEELQPEARGALIARFDCAHITVQARIRRRPLTSPSRIAPLRDLPRTAASLPLASH